MVHPHFWRGFDKHDVNWAFDVDEDVVYGISDDICCDYESICVEVISDPELIFGEGNFGFRPFWYV